MISLSTHRQQHIAGISSKLQTCLRLVTIVAHSSLIGYRGSARASRNAGTVTLHGVVTLGCESISFCLSWGVSSYITYQLSKQRSGTNCQPSNRIQIRNQYIRKSFPFINCALSIHMLKIPFNNNLYIFDSLYYILKIIKLNKWVL